MKQKVAKPIVLLMIAVGVCMIPMLAILSELVQSWYGAMCDVKRACGVRMAGNDLCDFTKRRGSCAVKYG